jgi:hypothetical protein
MIKFHILNRLESISQFDQSIFPGSFVRDPEVRNSVGIVISVTAQDSGFWRYAQVLWSKYDVNIYDNAVRGAAQQILVQEDAEIFRILDAASKVTT